MRVTTQMTNQVAEQTKIGVNRNSLLNASEGTTGSTLLDELNKTSEQKASTVMDGNYKKIASNADALEKAAELFMQTGDGSLLSNLDTEEGKKKAADQLGTLVEKYNATLSALGKSGDELNAYYAQMLKALVSENKDAFSAIGVSVDDSMRLSFDENKFNQAAAEDISGLLGADSDFMQKLAYLSDHIADNANANVKSIVSQYNAAGSTLTSALGAQLFDCRG